MQVPTNYKMGSGLAATIMGQQAGLEAESQGLQNLTQAMRQPQEMYKSEEAMAQMNDPRYIQMKIQNDMAKFGKDTSINEIESAYNNANRAAAHLKAASAMGPEALQQASLQYLQKMNIDPNSEQGQILLKDPIGNAEKMVQFYATAATNNPEYLRQYGLQGQKDVAAMERTQAQIEGHHEDVRTSAGATLAAAKFRTSNEKINEQAADAMRIARDPNASPQARKQAQQFLNDLIVYNQSKSAGFAGSTYGQGGFQPKSETAPKFNWNDSEESKPVIVTAPNGKNYQFKTQAEADAFMQQAGMKGK